jgi:hypothetical protein
MSGLSEKEIAKYFKSIAPEILCPICKNSSWQILGDDDIGYTSMIMINPEPPKKELLGWDVIPIACGNCGHINIHLKSVIRDKIRESDNEDK